MRLSGNATASGTITEVGSGYDISDLINNPPVLYDGNGDVVSVSQWKTERDPLGVQLKYMTNDGWRYIITAAAPQTYSY